MSDARACAKSAIQLAYRNVFVLYSPASLGNPSSHLIMNPALTRSILSRSLGSRFVVFAGAILAWLTNSHAAVLPSDATLEGRTLSEWSVEAWKWVYSIPASRSPSTDCDGQWANEGQPGGSVFFVAPLNGKVPPPCVRSFTVPSGKYLLVPVLPITIDNIDTLPPLGIEEFYDVLDSVVADPEDLFASIDGVAIPNLHQYRATSPPFSFNFHDVDNHFSEFYGHPVVGLLDPMVVDGYWLLLEPLTPGPHVLRTGGRFNGPVEYFKPHEIVAHIMVAPANRPPIADASATRLRTISVDQIRSPVVLDGSRSSDPDGDPRTFDWVERGATIARGEMVTHRFRAGSHSISLIVSDGSLKTTNSIVIQVITVGHAIEDLIQMAKRVLLSRRDAQSLVRQLVAARRAIDRGKLETGIHHLRAFQREVSRHLAKRDPATADALRRSAQEIIAALEGRSR